MKILIDVDGTVGDLVGGVIEHLGLHFPKVPLYTDVQHYEMFARETSPFTEEQIERMKSYMSTSGMGQKLKVITGSVNGFKRLEEAGHKVRWLTASYTTNPTWEYDRRIFLRKNFGSKDAQVFFVAMKHEIVGDVFIDDKWPTVAEWIAHNPHGLGLIYDQPWNQDAPRHIKRFTWDCIDALLDFCKTGAYLG